MAKRFRRPKRQSAISEINVTPLIDLAFSLLIIFMITTPLLEQSISVDLPAEKQKEQTPPNKDLFRTIAINKNKEYFWGEDAVTWKELEDRLTRLSADGKEDAIIHVRADSQLPYQNIIDVIDLIKQKNLSKISLDTQVK